MTITTIAEARSLVGRTFERNGSRRRINNVDEHRRRVSYWAYPKDLCSYPVVCAFDDFCDWLSEATEVVQR